MNGLSKAGIVSGGYVIALLAACAAVAVRVYSTQGPDSQESAGMYAAGDSLLFFAVFGVTALLPTALALYFLRPYRPIWAALSIAAPALAGSGFLAASVHVLAYHGILLGPTWHTPASLAVLRMLPAPLLVTAFVLAAFIAPTRPSRLALPGAAAIEGTVGAYTFFHWFASAFFHFRLTGFF